MVRSLQQQSLWISLTPCLELHHEATMESLVGRILEGAAMPQINPLNYVALAEDDSVLGRLDC